MATSWTPPTSLPGEPLDDAGGGVCRRSRQSLFAFVAVVGTSFLAIGVPVLVGTGLAAFAVVSLAPVLVVVSPLLIATGLGLLFAGLLVLAALAAMAYLRPPWWRRLRSWLVRWFFFLFPFHGLFLLGGLLLWSFWAGLALGACFFLQGEVFWNRKKPVRRWPALVNLVDSGAGAIFRYFPLRVLPLAAVVAADEGGEQQPHEQQPLGLGQQPLGQQPLGQQPLGQQRPAIFAFHPHGVYAFGIFSLVFQRSSGWGQALGRSSSVLLGVASALLHLPLAGTLFAFFGLVPASRACLDAACETEHDVALIPGGIAEMCAYESDDKEVLYILKRKGFVKLALRHGRPLIPVFSFGENRTFVQYTFARRLREVLSRKLGIIVQLFRGRWCTLIPFRVPITVAVGRPVYPPRGGIADPSPELVDKTHAIYMRHLRELFEETRGKHPGYENVELVFR